jgi:hypothetical protein
MVSSSSLSLNIWNVEAEVFSGGAVMSSFTSQLPKEVHEQIKALIARHGVSYSGRAE